MKLGLALGATGATAVTRHEQEISNLLNQG